MDGFRPRPKALGSIKEGTLREPFSNVAHWGRGEEKKPGEYRFFSVHKRFLGSCAVELSGPQQNPTHQRGGLSGGSRWSVKMFLLGVCWWSRDRSCWGQAGIYPQHVTEWQSAESGWTFPSGCKLGEEPRAKVSPRGTNTPVTLTTLHYRKPRRGVLLGSVQRTPAAPWLSVIKRQTIYNSYNWEYVGNS